MSTATAVSGSMRPLLRRDVIFGDTGMGVFIRTDDDGLVLNGKTIYKWLKAIAPLLDGSRTLDELRAGLPEAQATMLLSIVTALGERGFVRDDAEDERSALSEEQAQTYAKQIAYIHHFVGAPRRRFARFRAARIVAVGNSTMIRAALRMLHENGNEGACLEPSLDGVSLDEYDAVLLDADVTGIAVVAALEDKARACNTLLIPAFTLGQRSFVGPTLGGTHSPRWASVLARLDGGLTDEDARQLHQRTTFGHLPPFSAPSHTQAAMLGTMLGFDLFRHLTGCMTAETASSIVIQNHETLDLVVEEIVAHPLAFDATPSPMGSLNVDGFRAELDDCSAPAELRRDQEQHSEIRDYLPLNMHYTGLIPSVNDLGLAQSPVKVAAGTIVQIVQPGMTSPARRQLHAYHLHTPLQARIALVMAAAQAHADTWGWLEHVSDGAPEVDPWRITTWLGSEHGELPQRCVSSVSLRSGETTTVPAAAGFPLSPENRDLWFENEPAGVGAGRTLAQATRAALKSAIADLSLRRALATATELATVDLSAAPEESELGFLRNALEIMGLSATLVDISQPSLGATVVGILPGRAPELCCAPTLREAAVETLTRLTGQTQVGDTSPSFGLRADLDPDGLPLGTERVPHDFLGYDTSMSGILSELSKDFNPLLVETTTHDLVLCSLRTVRVLLVADPAEPGEDAN